MQNKYLSLAFVVLTLGEGGQTGWDKIPSFAEIFFLKAPLRPITLFYFILIFYTVKLLSDYFLAK